MTRYYHIYYDLVNETLKQNWKIIFERIVKTNYFFDLLKYSLITIKIKLSNTAISHMQKYQLVPFFLQKIPVLLCAFKHTMKRAFIHCEIETEINYLK